MTVTHQDCIFCKIIAKEIPSTKITENDTLIVIKDIAPKAPVHYLIIPKKHIINITSMEKEDTALIGNMMLMAKELSLNLPDHAFRIIINNGAQAGQRVFHLHLHFISGKSMSDF